MSNCCMWRPAKFHVDSAVRFWAIANIREGGGAFKRPPPVKRGLMSFIFSFIFARELASLPKNSGLNPFFFSFG